MSQPDIPADSAVIAATQRWLEKSVIGLNLCPFAHAVHIRQQIRYVVSSAQTLDDLLDDLEHELQLLSADTARVIETTLLIHPRMFTAFLEYNDFLETADAFVENLGFEGELQIASFHPQYQFAGTEPDDITNCTNRSPYPMLHLLRESSVAAAVAAFPDTDKIYLQNIETMRKLGADGWNALGLTPDQTGIGDEPAQQ
jgi:hypothetical protein